MLTYSPSPSRQAPSPWDRSAASVSGSRGCASPAEALQGALLTASRTPREPSRGVSRSSPVWTPGRAGGGGPTSFAERFLSATDEEVERLYFSRFGTLPGQRMGSPPQATTHASLLHDTSTDSDGTASDSEHPPARGPTQEQRGLFNTFFGADKSSDSAWHVVESDDTAGEDEVAAIEAHIQLLREKERREVECAFAAMERAGDWAYTREEALPPPPHFLAQGQGPVAAHAPPLPSGDPRPLHGSFHSPRPSRVHTSAGDAAAIASHMSRSPPLAYSWRGVTSPPHRVAPFRLPSHRPPPPLPLASDGTDSSDRSPTAACRESVVEVSSVSSTGSVSEATPLQEVEEEERPVLGYARGPYQCSPPPGDRIERVLHFPPMVRTRTLDTAAASTGPSATRFAATPPRTAAGTQVGARGGLPSDHRTAIEKQSGPAGFLSLTPYTSPPCSSPGEGEDAGPPESPPPVLVEVEVAPGQVVQVEVGPTQTAEQLAADLMAAHALTDTDGAVFDVLTQFFQQHAPAAGPRNVAATKGTELGAPQAPLQAGAVTERVVQPRGARRTPAPPPSSCTANARANPVSDAPAERHGASHAAAVRRAPLRPRGTDVAVPVEGRRPARTPAAANLSTDRSVAAAEPRLCTWPVKLTRAARLLAQANTARQEEQRRRQVQETAAEFYDPYLMAAPPAPRGRREGHRPRRPSTSQPTSRAPSDAPERTRESAAPRVVAQCRQPSRDSSYGSKPQGSRRGPSTSRDRVAKEVGTPARRRSQSPSPFARPPSELRAQRSPSASPPTMELSRSASAIRILPGAPQDRTPSPLIERIRTQLSAARQLLNTSRSPNGPPLFSPFSGR